VKRTLLVPMAAAVAALAVAGCGSSDNNSESDTSASTPPSTTETQTAPAPSSGAQSGGAAAGGELKLAADPSGQLKFDTSSLSAKAGKVTLVMDNPSSIPHAVAVEGNGVDKDGNTVGKGGVSKVSVDLKAGKYTFYCPVDSHKQAGMKGTLTVK
jgi:plastocyanin